MLNYSMMALCLSDHEGPESVVRKAVESGMKGIDWTGCAFASFSPEYLKKISEDAGLKVVSYVAMMSRFPNHEPGGRDELLTELDRAAGTGANKVLIPTMPLKRTDPDRSEIQKYWLELLASAAPACKDRNLVPMVENFPGNLSPVVTADDFFFFQREIPALRLTFDAGNVMMGEDPVESYQKSLPWIELVHFKDYTVSSMPSEKARLGLDGRWYTPALIGEGDCDHRSMLKTIVESGYKGWINVEYEGDGLPRADFIGRACANLRTFEP